MIEAMSFELRDNPSFVSELFIEKHDGGGVTATQFFVPGVFESDESALRRARAVPSFCFRVIWLLRRNSMRLTVLCLLASAVFPPVSRAQAPVFEITPVHSSIKFDVKASVDIAGKFDKWDATLKFISPDETTGSVDTGRGMKNGKLKSKTSSTLRRIR